MRRFSSSPLNLGLAGLLALGMAWGLFAPLPHTGMTASAAAPAEKDVVAVVACDGYADLKKQLRWVGTLVGNPALDGFAESFIMMATQFQGLAGLDVARPAGIVVTAAGELPVVQGCLPVKDLGKLLAALEGVVGPAQKEGDAWRLTPPGGLPLEIVEKNGWAFITPLGMKPLVNDPTEHFSAIVKTLTLGAQVFPSRMPAGLRERFRQALDQAADAAAAQGQPVDRAAVAAVIDSLDDMESLLVGVAVDTENERVFVEGRTVMEPNTAAAAVWTAAGKATDGTVATPPAANGRPLLLRAHHAQAVPEGLRAPLEATLDQALPGGDGDQLAQALGGLVRDLIAAMLDAGGFDLALAVDDAAVGADTALPAITLGAGIKDGPGLEKRVQERLGKEGVLSAGVTARFNTGRQGAANLHEIEVDLSGVPEADKFGGKVTLTLAVTPDRAYVLTGGDVAKRLAETLAAGAPQAKPLTGVDLSLASVLAYAAKAGKLFAPDNPQNAEVEQMAKIAADVPATLVQLLVRPIERGVSMRLSVDGGVIQTIATGVSLVQPGGVPGGIVPGGGFELRPGPGAPALAP